MSNKVVQRIAVTLAAVSILVGCTEATPSVPKAFEKSGTVQLTELPDRLLANYKTNRRTQLQNPDESTGYDYRSLDKTLDVFRTPEGVVFVDAEGGRAWAESCDAMTLFVEANAWTENGHGCLEE